MTMGVVFGRWSCAPPIPEVNLDRFWGMEIRGFVLLSLRRPSFIFVVRGRVLPISVCRVRRVSDKELCVSEDAVVEASGG